MPPDFNREVHCLLGLPFDAVNMAEAVRKVRVSATERTPCFLSTPNLNFLISAQSDSVFRDSVINSNLSVADGMPLVWIARMVGIPIGERVAGSALFDELRRDRDNPLTVFFFGGPEGAAEKACHRLVSEGKGLNCAGFESPGFGSVEGMSDESTIRRINASNADFLVVSLGAKKGQAWIEYNRSRITVPVYSHLGAVVNFVAGTVRRAPVWMQNAGLEWLWRIKEDPMLWRRYAFDGWAMLRLLMTRVIPLVWIVSRYKPAPRDISSAAIEIDEGGQEVRIRLGGAWVQQNLQPLRRCISDLAHTAKDIRIDMSSVTYIDSAFIGLLMLLYADRARQGARMHLVNTSKFVQRIFRCSCAEFLIDTPQEFDLYSKSTA